LIAALAQEAAKQNKCVKVHLHINTGMGRFGCRPEEALSLAREIRSYPSLELEGLMTHFACADDPQEDAFTWQQIACFDHVIQELREQGITVKWTHAANSSGVLRFSLPQYNMVRMGLATYGLYASEASRQALDLRLALSLTSRIVGINICIEGETISYGRRYRIAQGTQKIAVLPIGYFDGLHRNYSGKAHVLIRGQPAPMVGNICMDYMMVDVTHIPRAAVGDQVLIFGEDEYGYYLSPEELASRGDSIVHELMTCLGPRIQRVFVYEEGKQIR
jgi:alanine racemase/UDP-N-acetylmuramoyl-tripeptide--D-alanyl-D-alanine ligase